MTAGAGPAGAARRAAAALRRLVRPGAPVVLSPLAVGLAELRVVCERGGGERGPARRA